jgi:putative transposase
LSRVWNGWRGPLFYVQPDTVVRWQRERFRRFWAGLSKLPCRRRGRPATAAEIRRRIEQMAAANPLWRAPRIHGELKMLGIEISERTVSRILRTLRRPPTQTWKTFLRNHLGQLVSIDFFTVPTVTMKVLFVFIVLEHRRREVLHYNVTEHPTVAWTSQQIVEAFRRSGCAEVSHSRSGWYLRQRRWFADRVTAHGGSTHRAPESLAEPVRRTPDRLHPKRVLEPFRDPECPAS